MHAGLLPQWTVEEAAQLAAEVETKLQGLHFRELLRALYSATHFQWSPALAGTTRLATIAAVLTRLHGIRVLRSAEPGAEGLSTMV